jgi:hypothetical protein
MSYVRFTPESGHVQCTRLCPLWANSGHHCNVHHKLGCASFMAGFVEPLPFQHSPFSSSKAKQLG